MDFGEFRQKMESFRQSVDEAARSLKESQSALVRLSNLYRMFDAQEQGMANQVLVEWIQSLDENLRYDALALIDEFKVADALPALHRLASRLVASSAPSAPYELKQVSQILKDFAE